MGTVVLGGWLWQYADHVVKPKVPVSFGAVFIVVILAISIGAGLYTRLNSGTQTPTESIPLIDGKTNASPTITLSTPIPTPTTQPIPTPTPYPPPSPTLRPYTAFHNQEYRYNHYVPRGWVSMVGPYGLSEVVWRNPDGTADFGVVVTRISDHTIDE
jgi:hypothetical protein